MLAAITAIAFPPYQTAAKADDGATLSGSVFLVSGSSGVQNRAGSFRNAYGRSRVQKSENSSSRGISTLIWIETKEAPKREIRNEPIILDQKNQEFAPHILPLIAGETVRIRNSDPVYHNVFSLSKIKKFDVGRRPKGDYKDVTFSEPGLVDVFCDIHSHMHALIVVMPKSTQHWVERNGSGDFRFENLQPGNYTVHATALGYEMETVDITIEAGSSSVELPVIRLEP